MLLSYVLPHCFRINRNAILDLTNVFERAPAISGIARMHCFVIENGKAVTFLISEDNVMDIVATDCDKQQTSSSTPQNITAESVHIGDWYVVEYDGNLYPGEVIAIGAKNDYQVSVMLSAGKNWKWPSPRDKIFYVREKLFKLLEKPEVANSRGHYKFSTTF